MMEGTNLNPIEIPDSQESRASDDDDPEIKVMVGLVSHQFDFPTWVRETLRVLFTEVACAGLATAVPGSSRAVCARVGLMKRCRPGKGHRGAAARPPSSCRRQLGGRAGADPAASQTTAARKGESVPGRA